MATMLTVERVDGAAMTCTYHPNRIHCITISKTGKQTVISSVYNDSQSILNPECVPSGSWGGRD